MGRESTLVSVKMQRRQESYILTRLSPCVYNIFSGSAVTGPRNFCRTAAMPSGSERRPLMRDGQSKSAFSTEYQETLRARDEPDTPWAGDALKPVVILSTQEGFG